MARSVALALPFLVLGWVLGSLPACSAAEQFACNADAQCVVDGAAGRCEPEGVCSFPDEACPSGHRYGTLAGELSGECVGEASSSTAGAGMTSIDPEGTADADTGPSTSSTTNPSTSSTTNPSTSSTTSSTTDPSTSSTTSPTTDPSTSSTTNGPETGEEPNPYGPCADDSECIDGLCLVELHVCTMPCVRDDECPSAPGMGLSIECVPLPNDELGCAITCSNDEECVDGMVCLSNLCGWP